MADFFGGGSRPGGSSTRQKLKALTASVLRSRGEFRIAVFHAGPEELFRIRRREVEEISIPTSGKKTAPGLPSPLLETVLAFVDQLPPEGPEWILVADAAGLVLRDPSHLLPEIAPGPYPAASVDFYWTPRGDHPAKPSAGLWAVRRHSFTRVLSAWHDYQAEVREKTPPHHAAKPGAPDDLWSEFVNQLSLRKRPFEPGEVMAPAVDSMDWSAVRQSCWVTIPDWPEEEQWTFLQSLYLGTWFGDCTGFMLDLLDA
jgi:hypothetical protein